MKIATRILAAVVIVLLAERLHSVDLSCTASKVIEFRSRLAGAPVSDEEKTQLAQRNAGIMKQLEPMFTEANQIEARQRAIFDNAKERLAAADPALANIEPSDPRLQRELWRRDDMRSAAAESIDLQERLNEQEALQKKLLSELPSAGYRDNVEAAASRVAQKAGLTVGDSADRLAYNELLTTYAAATGLPTGSDDRSLAMASRQAEVVFDRPVSASVDAAREVLRTLTATDLQVELGADHLRMNAPPPALREEVMGTDNTASRSLSRHEAQLSQLRLQGQLAKKVLHTIKVPPPDTTSPNDSELQKGQLDRLAEELKKKSELVTVYILVGKKKADP